MIVSGNTLGGIVEAENDRQLLFYGSLFRFTAKVSLDSKGYTESNTRRIVRSLPNKRISLNEKSLCAGVVMIAFGQLL